MILEMNYIGTDCYIRIQDHPTNAMNNAYEILKLIMPKNEAWRIKSIDYVPGEYYDTDSVLVVRAGPKNRR